MQRITFIFLSKLMPCHRPNHCNKTTPIETTHFRIHQFPRHRLSRYNPTGLQFGEFSILLDQGLLHRLQLPLHLAASSFSFNRDVFKFLIGLNLEPICLLELHQ